MNHYTHFSVVYTKYSPRQHVIIHQELNITMYHVLCFQNNESVWEAHIGALKAFGSWPSHPFIVVYISFPLWLHTSHFCDAFLNSLIKFQIFSSNKKVVNIHQIEAHHSMFYEKALNGSRPCQNFSKSIFNPNFHIFIISPRSKSWGNMTFHMSSPHRQGPSEPRIKSHVISLTRPLIRACRRKYPRMQRNIGYLQLSWF